MLLDANVLIFAVDEASAHHDASHAWLEAALNGDERLALPWQTIGAFVRITTHPRLSARPLTAEAAWGFVRDWLDAASTWVPPATERTAAILGELLVETRVTGNLVTDAQLAAIAIEHGIAVVSADTDFVRFKRVRWINPLDP